MTDITDIRQIRKKRKTKKTIIRIVIVLIVIIIAFFGFLYRNEIRNFFEGAYNNISLTQNGSGYPQVINGTQIEKVFTSDGKIGVLSDMSLTVMSDSAKRITALKHSFNNPDAQINGRYILIFNRGGNKLSLYTNEKEIYTITTESPILEAVVSKGGRVAVATGSETNNTTLKIYSQSQEELLKWNSSNQVTAMDFTDDDSKLCVASIYTVNGLVNSDITVMKTTSSTPVYETTIDNEMLLRVKFNSKGNIFAIGDSRVFTISTQNGIEKNFKYETNLTAFAVSSDNLVILQGENAVADGGLISVFDYQLENKGSINVTQKIQSLNLSEEKIIFTTDKKVYVYGLDGTLQNEFISDGKYISAVVSDNKIVGITSSSVELLK